MICFLLTLLLLLLLSYDSLKRMFVMDHVTYQVVDLSCSRPNLDRVRRVRGQGYGGPKAPEHWSQDEEMVWLGKYLDLLMDRVPSCKIAVVASKARSQG